MFLALLCACSGVVDIHGYSRGPIRWSRYEQSMLATLVSSW
jgi:hypothetical protein